MGYFANGTEGMAFEEHYCSRCIHRDDEVGVDPPCPIWMAHLMYAYELCNDKDHPGKIMLDMLIAEREVTASDGVNLIVNECQMFVEGDPVKHA